MADAQLQTTKASPIETGRRGLMLFLSSPSGAGKTTLSRMLLEQVPGLEMSVSVTTRAMRNGEVDGKDYRFIDVKRFKEMVRRNQLLEHATVFDNFYGTPREPVEAALAAGRDVLFDIDWQGTQQLKQQARDDVVSVFVLPPSHDELERRLRARAQDEEEVVQRRMAKAADEISHWAEYDYIIVNEELEAALVQLETILAAERLKRARQIGLSEFARSLTVKANPG